MPVNFNVHSYPTHRVTVSPDILQDYSASEKVKRKWEEGANTSVLSSEVCWDEPVRKEGAPGLVEELAPRFEAYIFDS